MAGSHAHPPSGDLENLGRASLLGQLLSESVRGANGWFQVIGGLAQIELARTDDPAARQTLNALEAAAYMAGRLMRLVSGPGSSSAVHQGDVARAIQIVTILLRHRTGAAIRLHVRSELDPRPLPSVEMPTSDLALTLAAALVSMLDAIDAVVPIDLNLETTVCTASVQIRLTASSSSRAAKAGQSAGFASRLSICRRLLAGAGGSISAEDVPGGSLTCTLSVPVAMPIVPDRRRGTAGVLEGRRVLLVDDDESVRRVIGMIAADVGGATVIPCSSGESALGMIRQMDFDAVILDLRMPGISGEDVFRSMPDEVKTRTVFLTGDTVNRATHDFLATTRRPALFKPVEIDEVLVALRQVVSTASPN